MNQSTSPRPNLPMVTVHDLAPNLRGGRLRVTPEDLLQLMSRAKPGHDFTTQQTAALLNPPDASDLVREEFERRHRTEIAAREMVRCICCSRRLTAQRSRDRGIGPVCLVRQEAVA